MIFRELTKQEWEDAGKIYDGLERHVIITTLELLKKENEKLMAVVEAAKFMVDNHAPQVQEVTEIYFGRVWVDLQNAVKELEK